MKYIITAALLAALASPSILADEKPCVLGQPCESGIVAPQVATKPAMGEIVKHLCHRHLVLANLEALQAGLKGKKVNTPENPENQIAAMKIQVKKAITMSEKAFGKKFDPEQCDEKKLEFPISIQGEAGQLVVSASEDDFDAP
jgi:hypothetical protein